MKWNKWLGLGLVAILIIAVSGLAIAKKEAKEGQEGMAYREQEPGQDFMDQMAKRLGIDRETLDKLREIHRDAQKEQIRQRADLQIARMDFEDVIKSAKSSEAEIKKAADKLAAIQAQGIHNRVNALLKVKKLLTPEQYEKVVRLMIAMHRRPKGMMGMKPPMMRPGQGQEGRPLNGPMMQRPRPPQGGPEQGFAPNPPDSGSAQ